MKETCEFLKKCGVFFIATIDNDKPRVRPFGVIEIFEDKLYLQTGKIKNVSKQISINPNVEICGFYDGKWIRVEGILKRDDRIEAKKYILDCNPELRSMYNENDDNTEVLYFVKGKSTFYSFVSEPKVIEF